jgi:hypothetical protein
VVQFGAKNTFLLSCNHVLSGNGRVPKGTKVVSGALCGPGKKPQHIATFPGVGYFVDIGPGRNAVDCALARLERAPKAINPPTPKLPRRGTRVKKVGAASGTTYGRIVDTDADVSVDYSFGTFRFNNQILIEGVDGKRARTEFALDGDSGAIAVDNKGVPIGMVFAEAGRYAVACPLTEVLARLGARLAKVPDLKGLKATLKVANLARR